MRFPGHLASGFLVARYLTSRMELPAEERARLIRLGSAAGVLPDADFLYYVIKKRSLTFETDFQHHKWISHTFPLYVVPGLLTYLYARNVGNEKLRNVTMVMTASACVHLFLDLFGSGDGIMLFWPLSRRMDGVFLLDVHGWEWAERYAQHPISWIERLLIIFAVLALLRDLLRNRLT